MAEECRRLAQAATDADIKERWERAERRWTFLAKSYETTERLARGL